MPEPPHHRQPLREDIQLLGNILGDVIRQQTDEETFTWVETVRREAIDRRESKTHGSLDVLQTIIARSSLDQVALGARAFSTYFNLINLAEMNHRVRVLREREQQTHPEPISESIASAIAKCSVAGISDQQMQALMDRLDIELVFTAHPTQAKRRTVLSALRRVGQTLHAHQAPDLLPCERDRQEKQLRSAVTSLWVTGQNRTSKPTVTDEVRVGLFHLGGTVWRVVPEIYRTLQEALATHYPGVTPPDRFLRFASWIGGDRDGNPFVTANLTEETLRLHRGLALTRHHDAAHDLQRSLSASRQHVDVNDAILDLVARHRDTMSEHLQYIAERYPNEPFRIVAGILADKLDHAAHPTGPHRIFSDRFGNRQPILESGAFRAYVDSLHSGLAVSNLEVVADTEVASLQTQAKVFGLHAARLDLREHSEVHTVAIDELARITGLEESFATRTPDEQAALLSSWLVDELPAWNQWGDLSAATRETVDLFELLARVLRQDGREALGTYIISMSRHAADILAVLFLARWSGLCLGADASRPEGISITPLFETRQDLVNAKAIMTLLFQHPSYAEHLRRDGRRQIIMIGYSDSNKDAGFLSANWELYQAQAEIASCGNEQEIDITLFHGRGGSIARGGGPVDRSILAQPQGSVAGTIRITEQGEVIDQAYDHPGVAKRHLEQVVHATIVSSLPNVWRKDPPAEFKQSMQEMAAIANRAYRSFVYEKPDLVKYWMMATPIAELSLLRIGSRPAKRASGDPMKSLRAIPWVFSWMQSRHVLPGWYGLGHALRHVGEQAGGLDQLQAMYRDWTFFHTVIDNGSLCLCKADMNIAREYSGLVKDRDLRDHVFGQIQQAYEETIQWVLRVTQQNELMDNQPFLQHSIRRRNPYIDPLNLIQVQLLRDLRSLPDSECDEAQRLRRIIFLTVDGIASGLKSTG